MTEALSFLLFQYSNVMWFVVVAEWLRRWIRMRCEVLAKYMTGVKLEMESLYCSHCSCY